MAFIKNVNFKTWCLNHSEDHDAKWCRELFPWFIFRKIKFANEKLNIPQEIITTNVKYSALIESIELQNNGKYKCTFDFSTIPLNVGAEWRFRKWNTKFQIIYSQDFNFVTVFTKKKDPSKVFVKKFLNENYSSIVLNRSKPISDLLLKSLVSYIIIEGFPSYNHYEDFEYVVGGYIRIKTRLKEKIKRKNSPIYSNGREHWIMFAYTEEEAHKVALLIGNQTKKLTMIYLSPVYTRHFRCKYPNTEILSLIDFLNNQSPEKRKKYESQVKLLQIRLNELKLNEVSIEQLEEEIKQSEKVSYDIFKTDILEGLSIMKVHSFDNEYDVFYYFSAMNLLNAWVNKIERTRSTVKKKDKYFRDMYYFKRYVSEAIVELIKHPINNVGLFVKKGIHMISVFGFQLSFNSINKQPEIEKYKLDPLNKFVKWDGKRLQPIAPLVLNLSKKMRIEYYKNKN